MSEEDYDLIEKNLSGTASADERETFSRRMSDASFRKDYEEFAEVQKAIRVHERARLKALLEKEESGSKTLTQKIWPWALAASIAFILGITYVVLNSSNDNIAEKYYATYTGLTIDKPRGAADDYRLKTEAYEAYKKNNASMAIQMIDSVLEFSPNDEEALFIRGLSNLQSKKYDEAVADLAKVKGNHDAPWFLALGYLGKSDVSKARVVLEKISMDEASSFKDKAGELLKAMPDQGPEE